MLDTPFALPSGVRFKNRIAKAAMTEGLAARDGVPNDDHVRLYRRWAAGGIGLSITGNVVIDRDHRERAQQRKTGAGAEPDRPGRKGAGPAAGAQRRAFEGYDKSSEDERRPPPRQAMGGDNNHDRVGEEPKRGECSGRENRHNADNRGSEDEQPQIAPGHRGRVDIPPHKNHENRNRCDREPGADHRHHRLGRGQRLQDKRGRDEDPEEQIGPPIFKPPGPRRSSGAHPHAPRKLTPLRRDTALWIAGKGPARPRAR